MLENDLVEVIIGHFYVFKPPRELAEIDAELKVVTDRILTMIGGLTK